MDSTVKDLKAMAKAMEELQLNLEPVRDKALDQKAFYTGYAQCAEQMIKVIATRMQHFKNQVKELETGELVEYKQPEEPVEEPVEEKAEAPLVVDPEPKPKNGRRKRKTKETQA